jgi:hypothetical protein
MVEDKLLKQSMLPKYSKYWQGTPKNGFHVLDTFWGAPQVCLNHPYNDDPNQNRHTGYELDRPVRYPKIDVGSSPSV